MSKIQNPFQKEDWIEEMIKQAPEFKEFQKTSFNNFKAIKKLEEKKYEVEDRSSFFDIFQVFTTHALTASLTAMLCLGGVATFAAEKTLPAEFKPSTIVSKINPFQENLKGNKKWYWDSESSLVSSSISPSSQINLSSISNIISSVITNSSNSSLSASSQIAIISSSTNSSSSVITQSKISSSSIVSSPKSISAKSSSSESKKSESEISKSSEIKLKFGEVSQDKSIFTMKDGEGNIYSFNNIKGISTDFFDLKNQEQEYIFVGSVSETVIDRAKYPAIKWRIYNVNQDFKIEKPK